jgi:hypothetical protein
MKQKKKKENQSLVQEQYNYSLSCSGVTPLVSSPVCLCVLGRFGVLLWWLVCMQGPGRPVEWKLCGAVVWWAYGAAAWWSRSLAGLGTEAWQSSGQVACIVGT